MEDSLVKLSLWKNYVLTEKNTFNDSRLVGMSQKRIEDSVERLCFFAKISNS